MSRSLTANVILKKATDDNGERLVAAWNAVKGVTVADCIVTLAQLTAQTLANSPDDIRADIWVSFVEILADSCAILGIEPGETGFLQ